LYASFNLTLFAFATKQHSPSMHWSVCQVGSITVFPLFLSSFLSSFITLPGRFNHAMLLVSIITCLVIPSFLTLPGRFNHAMFLLSIITCLVVPSFLTLPGRFNHAFSLLPTLTCLAFATNHTLSIPSFLSLPYQAFAADAATIAVDAAALENLNDDGSDGSSSNAGGGGNGCGGGSSGGGSGSSSGTGGGGGVLHLPPGAHVPFHFRRRVTASSLATPVSYTFTAASLCVVVSLFRCLHSVAFVVFFAKKKKKKCSLMHTRTDLSPFVAASLHRRLQRR
jgi:hypothetical protein